MMISKATKKVSAAVQFYKNIKDLPSPDQLPKRVKKRMIFDESNRISFQQKLL